MWKENAQMFMLEFRFLRLQAWRWLTAFWDVAPWRVAQYPRVCHLHSCSCFLVPGVKFENCSRVLVVMWEVLDCVSVMGKFLCLYDKLYEMTFSGDFHRLHVQQCCTVSKVFSRFHSCTFCHAFLIALFPKPLVYLWELHSNWPHLMEEDVLFHFVCSYISDFVGFKISQLCHCVYPLFSAFWYGVSYNVYMLEILEKCRCFAMSSCCVILSDTVSFMTHIHTSCM
jgi:hypothetical protein